MPLLIISAVTCLCCSFTAAASKLVCQTLQLPSLRPDPVSMRQLVHEHEQQTGPSTSSSSSSAGPVEPVLFVTTAGADPTQELASFAEAEVGRERLHEVAMGQGQFEVALQLLRDCAHTGGQLGAWNGAAVVQGSTAARHQTQCIIRAHVWPAGIGLFGALSNICSQVVLVGCSCACACACAWRLRVYTLSTVSCATAWQ